MQIKKIIYIFLCIIIVTYPIKARRSSQVKQHKTFTVMLDPAGDAKHTGRNIGNTLERGITLQYAEKLKSVLEAIYKNITVYLTRFPGELIHPLQNASYANRLNINLYININFYQETKTIPRLFLYRFSYNDDFITPSKNLTLYRYDQAHILHNSTTHTWAALMQKTLMQENYKKLFEIHGVYKLPCKPLIGIIAPAISIEAGLKTPHNWKPYVMPIAHVIGLIIEQYNEN